MKGKLFLAACLLLLLFCLSYAGFSPPALKASNILPVHDLNTGLSYGTIQDAINANETVNGDTIEVDSGIYYESIDVNKSLTLVGEDRDTTIIDGNGTGTWTGFQMYYGIIVVTTNYVSISNFTVRNAGLGDGLLEFHACVSCIFYNQHDIDVENNTFQNASRGVVVAGESQTNISNNNISNMVSLGIDAGVNGRNVDLNNNYIQDCGDFGINVDGSTTNCQIANNTMVNDYGGIDLARNLKTLNTPSNVILSSNLIHDCGGFGIFLYGDVNNCSIINNTVENTPTGIDMQFDKADLLAPFDNLIDGNILTNDNCTNILYFGSSLFGPYQESYTNVFRNNSLTNLQHHNLMIWGYNLPGFMQDIDTSNMANNKTIYYLTNRSNLELDPSSLPNAGSLALVNCANATVRDFNFTGNNDGLLLAGSTDCTLTNLTLANNQIYLFNQTNPSINAFNQTNPSIYGGLTLFNSTGNTVVDCRICNNTCGVWLSWLSDGNTFYHNNFVDNDQQVISDIDSPFENVSYGTPSTCTWNNTVEGNYWSDYNGSNVNQDGIGDSPYVIDSSNTDHYPLMGMFNSFNATSQCSVETICNSTISDFQFNGTAISFNASGENGTTGFCRICFPTALINETFTVFVNGTKVPYSLLPETNSTNSYLYFTYSHSTQVIIAPEFPSFLILSLFLIATLLTAMMYTKRPTRTT